MLEVRDTYLFDETLPPAQQDYYSRIFTLE